MYYSTVTVRWLGSFPKYFLNCIEVYATILLLFMWFQNMCALRVLLWATAIRVNSRSQNQSLKRLKQIVLATGNRFWNTL